MGVFQGTIYSKSLRLDVGLTVILPHDSRKHRGIEPLAEGVIASKNPKTLLLLHGLSDNHSAWLNKTAIYRYAESYDIAVVMPEVHRSFYQNMKTGLAFGDYISQELPQLASDIFHVSVEPQDLLLAGLSMGGYGSLYHGLKCPERYAAIGAFSSPIDMVSIQSSGSSGMQRDDLSSMADMEYAFGRLEESTIHEHDLYYRLEQAERMEKKLPIFMTVGQDDPLCEMNKDFAAKLEEKKYPHEFILMPGTHDWDVWDASIKMFLERFAK